MMGGGWGVGGGGGHMKSATAQKAQRNLIKVKFPGQRYKM